MPGEPNMDKRTGKSRVDTVGVLCTLYLGGYSMCLL